MTDSRLRELERRFKETGSIEDEAAWLKERVRTGEVLRREEMARLLLVDPAAATEFFQQTYSYTVEEQETFGYLKEYMQRVSRVGLAGLLAHESGRERFALAGIFLVYRTLNHWGCDLADTEVHENLDELHRERLAGLERWLGRPIPSTREYLDLLGWTLLTLLNPFASPGKKLARWVQKTGPLKAKT